MPSFDINIHGPLSATNTMLVSSGKEYGIVRVNCEGSSATIFAPSPSAGQAIADAINAAWAKKPEETT